MLEVADSLVGTDFDYITDYFYASTPMYQSFFDEGTTMASAYIQRGKSYGDTYKKMSFAPFISKTSGGDRLYR